MDREKTYNEALELFADCSKEDVIKAYVDLFLERNEAIKICKEFDKEYEKLKKRFIKSLKLNVEFFSKLIEEYNIHKKNISEEKKQHMKDLTSPKWKEKREEVFERYGKQCVECGSTKNIQVHHLIYRKGHHLWEYDVDELLPLCKKCHQKVHNDKTHKYHEKYE